MDRDEIIELYYPIVKRMVKKLVVKMPEGFDEDDFVQVGMMGLLKAIDKLDTTKSMAEFKSYANTKIRGAILDKIRSVDYVSRYARDKLKRVSKSYRYFMDKGIFNPSDEQVAEASELDMDEFNKLISESSNHTIFSLDEAISDGDMLVIESIENKSSDDPLKIMEEQEKKQIVMDSLQQLSKMELTVLSLYYYEDFSLKEIADIIEKTESRVSQIKTKALIKLREFARKRSEEDG